MERSADAAEDRVRVEARPLPLIAAELERMVQEELVRQVLVGHASLEGGGGGRPGEVVEAREGDGAALRVEALEGLGAADLAQLEPQPRDLGGELRAEAGVGRLVGGEVRLGLVERDERVPDAARQPRLVGDLPRAEAAEVVEQQRREALGERAVHGLEGARRDDGARDGLEVGDQRDRHLEEALRERRHGLEDVRRPEGDHVAGEEHPRVDRLRGDLCGRGAVQEGAHQVDALQEAPGDVDDVGRAEVDDQGLEAARRKGNCSQRKRGAIGKCKFNYAMIVNQKKQTRQHKSPDRANMLKGHSNRRTQEISSERAGQRYGEARPPHALQLPRCFGLSRNHNNGGRSIAARALGGGHSGGRSGSARRHGNFWVVRRSKGFYVGG
jgi:hypothetical protein